MKELHEGHDHAHTCDHDHEHGACGHDHSDAPDMARMIAFLEYMVEHNGQHAAEVGYIVHMLYHAEEDAAANLLEDAVGNFEAGTEKLSKALALIKGGK